MAAIDDKLIAAAYGYARDHYFGKISEAEAIDSLVARYSMNRGSAGGYVRVLRHMLNGDVYTRTINQLAVRYYLDSIQKEFGSSAVVSAVQSLNLHIAYYEPKAGARMKSLRQIADHFSGTLAKEILPDFDKQVVDLETEVKISLALSRQERRRRLPPAGTKPRIIRVSTRVFVRNAHVIAEILTRASGACERCGETAPFERIIDGSPYLEIHHIIRLADGGDDTVENAEALCPNCHRRRHHGPSDKS